MNILQSLQWRYATKKFDATFQLEKEKLNLIKEAFNLTATSYGLQPIKMVVIEDKELREKLVPVSFNQRQVVDASFLLIICIQKDFTPEDVKKYFNLVHKTRNTPEEILADFKNNVVEIFSKKSTEEIQAWSKSQAYLALGNLLAVCATLEIDSCPMEGFLPEKLDAILDLESKNLKSALLLPIGKRADDDFMANEKKVRKPLEESVIEI